MLLDLLLFSTHTNALYCYHGKNSAFIWSIPDWYLFLSCACSVSWARSGVHLKLAEALTTKVAHVHSSKAGVGQGVGGRRRRDAGRAGVGCIDRGRARLVLSWRFHWQVPALFIDRKPILGLIVIDVLLRCRPPPPSMDSSFELLSFSGGCLPCQSRRRLRFGVRRQHPHSRRRRLLPGCAIHSGRFPTAADVAEYLERHTDRWTRAPRDGQYHSTRKRTNPKHEYSSGGKRKQSIPPPPFTLPFKSCTWKLKCARFDGETHFTWSYRKIRVLMADRGTGNQSLAPLKSPVSRIPLEHWRMSKKKKEIKDCSSKSPSLCQ